MHERGKKKHMLLRKMLKFSVQHQKLPLGLSYPNKLCFFSLIDKRVEPKLEKLNPPKQKLQLHFHHARASSLPKLSKCTAGQLVYMKIGYH
jgi:hypothetical protein